MADPHVDQERRSAGVKKVRFLDPSKMGIFGDGLATCSFWLKWGSFLGPKMTKREGKADVVTASQHERFYNILHSRWDIGFFPLKPPKRRF